MLLTGTRSRNTSDDHAVDCARYRTASHRGGSPNFRGRAASAGDQMSLWPAGVDTHLSQLAHASLQVRKTGGTPLMLDALPETAHAAPLEAPDGPLHDSLCVHS